MKGKSVFYLCLFVAFLSYSFGFGSGYWFFINWVMLGAFLMKCLFWIVLFGVGIFVLWIMFRKKDKTDGEVK